MDEQLEATLAPKPSRNLKVLPAVLVLILIAVTVLASFFLFGNRRMPEKASISVKKARLPSYYTEMSIHEDGAVTVYVGGVLGQRIDSSISKTEMKQLVKLFYSNNFFSLEREYQGSVNWYYYEVEYNDSANTKIVGNKLITRSTSGAPKNYIKIVQALDDIQRDALAWYSQTHPLQDQTRDSVQPLLNEND